MHTNKNWYLQHSLCTDFFFNPFRYLFSAPAAVAAGGCRPFGWATPLSRPLLVAPSLTEGPSLCHQRGWACSQRAARRSPWSPPAAARAHPGPHCRWLWWPLSASKASRDWTMNPLEEEKKNFLEVTFCSFHLVQSLEKHYYWRLSQMHNQSVKGIFFLLEKESFSAKMFITSENASDDEEGH